MISMRDRGQKTILATRSKPVVLGVGGAGTTRGPGEVQSVVKRELVRSVTAPPYRGKSPDQGVGAVCFRLYRRKTHPSDVA